MLSSWRNVLVVLPSLHIICNLREKLALVGLHGREFCNAFDYIDRYYNDISCMQTSRDARTHRDAHLLIFDGASKQKALSVGTDSRKTVLSITGSIFLNNTGKEGGAVLARAIDTFNVTQTIFTKNYASQGRGGGFQAQVKSLSFCSIYPRHL